MEASLKKILLAACLVFSCVTLETHTAYASSARTQKRRATSHKQRPKRKLREPDVIFVPTPPETVDEMLRQAHLKKGDVLYDLGSGDGRIPIAAAKQYGVRAVGIDIDPKLADEAKETARREGVENLVSFRNEDMFLTDVREASVVTLYLSNTLNVMLRPKLLRELRPGSLIISHDFRMGDWAPEKTVRVPWKNLYRTVYVWTVPRGGRYRKS
jgi:tRNA G10  N-methylase Trm11